MYINKGYAYYQKSDYDRAIADCTEAIRLNPNNADPYRHRAFAHMNKGSFTQARADVDRALQINPNYQDAQTLSAELRQKGYVFSEWELYRTTTSVIIEMDMSHLYDRITQETNVHNVLISEEVMQEVRSPQINRVTVAVNIDGTWKWKFDEKGDPVIQADGTIEREYTPVPAEQLHAATALVRNAIGYNPARGDSVTVQNIPFDRTREFSEEDAAYFRKKQIQRTLIIILYGLTLLLVVDIIADRLRKSDKRPNRPVSHYT